MAPKRCARGCASSWGTVLLLRRLSSRPCEARRTRGRPRPFTGVRGSGKAGESAPEIPPEGSGVGRRWRSVGRGCHGPPWERRVVVPPEDRRRSFRLATTRTFFAGPRARRGSGSMTAYEVKQVTALPYANALSLNAHDAVVGDYGDGAPEAFIARQPMQGVRVVVPGSSSTSLVSINDQGVAVGRWRDSQGRRHASCFSRTGRSRSSTRYWGRRGAWPPPSTTTA